MRLSFKKIVPERGKSSASSTDGTGGECSRWTWPALRSTSTHSTGWAVYKKVKYKSLQVDTSVLTNSWFEKLFGKRSRNQTPPSHNHVKIIVISPIQQVFNLTPLAGPWKFPFIDVYRCFLTSSLAELFWIDGFWPRLFPRGFSSHPNRTSRETWYLLSRWKSRRKCRL